MIIYPFVWNGVSGGGGSGGGAVASLTGNPTEIVYIDNTGNGTGDSQFTRDSDTKTTIIGAEIPAAYAADNNLPNPFAVIADVPGDQGNSIALVANGTDDVDTIVANWNASPNIPGNTATVVSGGTSVPDAGTYTLKGGGESRYNLGSFGGAIYGNVFATQDTTNQINSIFGQGNLSGFTGSPWGNAFFVQDEANNYLTGYVQGVQKNSIVSIDLGAFSYFASAETSPDGVFIQYVDTTTNSGFYAEPNNKTYIKSNSVDFIFPTSLGSNGDVLSISSQTGNEAQLAWVAPSGAGSVGSVNDVQVADGSGNFLASPDFNFNPSTSSLYVNSTNGLTINNTSKDYKLGNYQNLGENSYLLFTNSTKQFEYIVDVPVFSPKAFTGTGTDNLTFSGSTFNGPIPTTWTLTVDTPTGQVNSGLFQVGSGLNDISFTGTYSGNGNSAFLVTIDGTGAPDTFSWSVNGNVQSVGVPIVAGVPFLLQDGISVTFAADTGHTLNDAFGNAFGVGAVEYIGNTFVGSNIQPGTNVTGSVSGATGTVLYCNSFSSQVILANLSPSTQFETGDVIDDGTGNSVKLALPIRINATYNWTDDGGATNHPLTPMTANNAYYDLDNGMQVSFADVASNFHDVGDVWTFDVTNVAARKMFFDNNAEVNTSVFGDKDNDFNDFGTKLTLDHFSNTADLQSAGIISIGDKTNAINGTAVIVDVPNQRVTLNSAKTKITLPAYADDAAAGVGGLVTGEMYQTSGSGAAPLNVAGIVMVKQ